MLVVKALSRAGTVAGGMRMDPAACENGDRQPAVPASPTSRHRVTVMILLRKGDESPVPGGIARFEFRECDMHWHLQVEIEQRALQL